MTIAKNDFDKLSRRTILFGHQSVGQNILDALVSMQYAGKTFNIEKISERDGLKEGCINHLYLGNNGDPEGKIKGFVAFVNANSDHPPDIALFKFCYLDIDQQTDIERLFSLYTNAVTELKRKFPGMVIVHTTVPLRQLQTGPKAWIKRILGKPLTGLSDNMARQRFNAAMRQAYGQELLYDIALGESTYPDGRRESFRHDGGVYYALVPEYTDDGDHLNKQGAEVLARQLVAVLTQAAQLQTLP